jgi:hypothetical protein
MTLLVQNTWGQAYPRLGVLVENGVNLVDPIVDLGKNLLFALVVASTDLAHELRGIVDPDERQEVQVGLFT